MADKTDFENGRISNFQCHVTFTLDRAIWHTIVYHSSTTTYIYQISFESEKLFVDGRTYSSTFTKDRKIRQRGKLKTKIRGMTWPEQPPDLKIIENAWRTITLKLQSDTDMDKIMQAELMNAVSKPWRSLSFVYIQSVLELSN